MSSKKRKPNGAGDPRVLAASNDLVNAHTRVKQLRRELRNAEGDARRSLSLLRKLTTATPRPRHVPGMYRPTRSDDVRS